MQGLSPGDREVLEELIAVKMLKSFTLMYSSCVGVLMKRDSELTCKEAGGSFRGSPHAKHAAATGGGLFRWAAI